jgi:hypothetical protein
MRVLLLPFTPRFALYTIATAGTLFLIGLVFWQPRLKGLGEDDVLIGDRFRIGSAEVAVTIALVERAANSVPVSEITRLYRDGVASGGLHSE